MEQATLLRKAIEKHDELMMDACQGKGDAFLP